MKKKQALIFLVWTLNFLGLNFPAASANLEIYSPIDYLFEFTNSPDDLSNFMKRNFKFTEDETLFGEIDYWQSPEEFYSRKKGDCEDYALFAQYVLARLNMESYVVSIYAANGYAHTLLIYREGGRYQVLNEDRLIRYNASSLEDAIGQVNSDWSWAAIARRQDTRGFALQTFFNL
ncbi:MAG: transglutaminase-like cysteine peptidase [Candidatus Omnitrophica bacterium]|nr:transglutaminase-like cysteine peptidase [Candidatus Omnitrophota bacterium]